MNGKVYLKVKIKSLAEEARIIRREEKRAIGALRDGLHLHRVIEVRREARASLIAYGFIRRRSLAHVDTGVSALGEYRALVLRQRVSKLISKYGDPRTTQEQIDAWFQGRAPEQAAAPGISTPTAAGSTPAGSATIVARVIGAVKSAIS